MVIECSITAQWDDVDEVPTHCPHCLKPIGPLWWQDAPDEDVERWIEGGGTIRIDAPDERGLRGFQLFNKVMRKNLNRRLRKRRLHMKKRGWLFRANPI